MVTGQLSDTLSFPPCGSISGSILWLIFTSDQPDHDHRIYGQKVDRGCSNQNLTHREDGSDLVSVVGVVHDKQDHGQAEGGRGVMVGYVFFSTVELACFGT